MREKNFVEQNKEKWHRFEQLFQSDAKKNPEELSNLFVQITDDLSYSKTFYPNRSIRVYLNNLAQKVYFSLYKNKSGSKKAFAHFWLEDLPAVLFRSRKDLFISLFIFVLAMVIGIISSVHDPDFAQVILGSDYIETTNKNIESGDPMAIYKSASEVDMFLGITFNNLLVAFRTFILGAFFVIGAVVIMLFNGIMVGTFQYYFIERGLFQESFLTIWMHGTLEISSIIIAGAAGLIMGKGLLFPGTLPRLQAFQIGARNGIKIMIGLVPIFILAAFIESFATRYTDAPDFIRALFIFVSFAFVVTYFAIYPWLKFRNSPPPPISNKELLPPGKIKINLFDIKSSKEIFTDVFVLIGRLAGKTALIALSLSLTYTALFYFFYRNSFYEKLEFVNFFMFNLFQFHNYQEFQWNFFLNTFLIGFTIWFALKFVLSSNKITKIKIGVSPLIKILLITALFEFAFLSDNTLLAALAIMLIPFLLLILIISIVEKCHLPAASKRMFSLLTGSRRSVFVTFLSLLLVSLLFLFLIDSPFVWFYYSVLQWNLNLDYVLQEKLAYLILTFINQFSVSMVLPIFIYGSLMEYYSAYEAKNAVELKREVETIGIKKKSYGLERE